MLREIALNRLIRPGTKLIGRFRSHGPPRHDNQRLLASSGFNAELVKISAGQVTSWTHPHLIQDGHIVPGVGRDEFRQRRSNVIEEIWSQHTAGNHAHLVVVPSANPQFMSEKIPFPYRQSSDLAYLSGCLEAGSALVLHSQSRGRLRELLFVRGRDSAKELWDGPRFAADHHTADFFGVDEVLPVAELGSYLKNFAQDKAAEGCTLWYEKSESPAPMMSVRSTVDTFLFNHGTIVKVIPTSSILHSLRLIKSASEAELMRTACRIGALAIAETISQENTVRQKGAEFIEECSIASRVDFECRRRGAQQLGYPPVVATGPRTNTIHYVANNNRGRPGDLALMDAGCEYFGYNSDITRTWPLSGRFTGPQIALYEAVLDVQLQLINMLEQRPTLNQLFTEMCLLLGKNLKELCLLPGSASSKELATGAHMFCPHHVSHFLGMDIHDTSSISHNLPIQPGMVITMEPGVYVRPTHKSVPEEFRGIGIRIEDDILITESGYEVLSSDCPKSVTEIERLICHAD